MKTRHARRLVALLLVLLVLLAASGCSNGATRDIKAVAQSSAMTQTQTQTQTQAETQTQTQAETEAQATDSRVVDFDEIDDRDGLLGALLGDDLDDAGATGTDGGDESSVTRLPPRGFQLQVASIDQVEIVVAAVDVVRRHVGGTGRETDTFAFEIGMTFEGEHGFTSRDFSMVSPTGAEFVADRRSLVQLAGADLTVPIDAEVTDLSGWKLVIAAGDQSAVLEY